MGGQLIRFAIQHFVSIYVSCIHNTYAPLNCYRLQVFGQTEVLKSVTNHQLLFSHLHYSVSVFRTPFNLDNIRLPVLCVLYANQRAFSYRHWPWI